MTDLRAASINVEVVNNSEPDLAASALFAEVIRSVNTTSLNELRASALFVEVIRNPTVVTDGRRALYVIS